jgi:hypothetical protein
MNKIYNYINKNKDFLLSLIFFFFGFVGYYSGYYFLIYFTSIHFLILIIKKNSPTVNKLLENFKNDQIIIKNHYKKDFLFIYYIILFIKIITFLMYFYLYWFYISIEENKIDWNNINSLEEYSSICNFVFIINCIFVLALFLDLFIRQYIVLYKNHTVSSTFINFCYNCIVIGGPALGTLHMTSYFIGISPNLITNTYQIYSPIGRGYGVWSSGQIFQIDYLKTQLGGDFDYKELIDQNKMVDPKKLENYAESKNITITMNKDIIESSLKNDK